MARQLPGPPQLPQSLQRRHVGREDGRFEFDTRHDDELGEDVCGVRIGGELDDDDEPKCADENG